MKTTASGQRAEAAVAHQLKVNGFQIVARNWKTAVCEIDIVAKKGATIYFVEVKYRSTASQGAGFEHIGAKKLQKMDFAARVWAQHHNFYGDYRLVAAEVSGLDAASVNIVEIS